ncbi:MAG: hypothetical protein IJF67_07690 [Clostridia bacterium]|nr:hypothetical protein [Clostridia bacterium]
MNFDYMAHLGDTAYLQKQINENDEIIIPRKNPLTGDELWLVRRRLVLDSNKTVILDGAHLRLDDGVFEQIFATEPEMGMDQSPKENIKIIGRNGAVLDGGNFNGLTEKTQRKNGFPRVLNNSPIFFRNVTGFEIIGLRILEQRYWGMTFYDCSEGVIRDIEFEANNGAPNQDGIDLRMGCHHIVIENIVGKTGDDTVALTALRGHFRNPFIPADACPDIHDVVIRNVVAECTGGHGIIRLLCHDGCKVYNITVEDILDKAIDGGRRSQAAIRIGDPNYASISHAKDEDMYNLTIRRIRTDAPAAIKLHGNPANFVIEDIDNKGGEILMKI